VLLLIGYAAFMFFTKSPVGVEVAANKKSGQQTKIDSMPSSVLQAPTQPNVNSSLSSLKQKPQLAAADKTLVDPAIGGNQPSKPGNAIIATAKQKPAKHTSDTFNIPGTAKQDSTVIAKNKLPVNTNDAVTGVQNPVTQDNNASNQVKPATADKVIANNSPKNVTESGKSYDELVNSRKNRSDAVAKNSEEKNLSYALVVQPGIGNQKMNYSTGVQVSYKVSQRISINSGVGYSSLNATASGSVASTRRGSVQNVNLALSGVEVPLAVQYKTDKGFYVAAGVMGMSVVNNRLDYNYVTQSVAATTMLDKSNASYSALSVVSENKTEESKEKVGNYLGFYIFSAGKKQPIGKKNNINFGPFLRVPFGAVSSEKIRLLQGGISLGLDF
jgi:hypothetical protein